MIQPHASNARGKRMSSRYKAPTTHQIQAPGKGPAGSGIEYVLRTTSSCSTRKVLPTRSSSVWGCGGTNRQGKRRCLEKRPSVRTPLAMQASENNRRSLGGVMSRWRSGTFHLTSGLVASGNVTVYLVLVESANSTLGLRGCMIGASGARGPGFNSRTGRSCSAHIRCIICHVQLRTCCISCVQHINLFFSTDKASANRTVDCSFESCRDHCSP